VQTGREVKEKLEGFVVLRSGEARAASSRGLQSEDSGGMFFLALSPGLGKHTRGRQRCHAKMAHNEKPLDTIPGREVASFLGSLRLNSRPRLNGSSKLSSTALYDRDQSAGQIVETLYRGVKAHAGNDPQQDDITSVVCKMGRPSASSQ
jgi:hypothetical protein